MKSSRFVMTFIAMSTMPLVALAGNAIGTVPALQPPPVVLLGEGSASNAAQSAVMYINHLNFVIAKLGRMNDLFVLQQEYENLTDNNLNLTTIHDELTVQLIMELRDALKDLQKDNVKILKAQSDFEREKDAAIWSALPQPAMFIAAVDPVTLAIAVGGAALTSIQNYQAAKARAEGKYNDKLFDVGNEKLEHINEINKELFKAQWRLMKKYGIHENDRITRADSELFLGFAEVLNGNADVRDDYSLNAVVRDIFANHESEMGGLPFYWITRASAAKKLDDLADIKYCCESYFRLYGTTPIIRRDMDACAMALLYVATIMKESKENINVAWVRSWLQFVEDTVRIPEWATKFCVAMLYREIGDEVRAQEVLYKSFLEVYVCIKVWEKSGKTKKNIFRRTPAMEKAYEAIAKNDKKISDGLPNWEADAKELVPYSGYIWLSGALYKSGRTDIYDRMMVDPAEVGVAVKYITGKYRRHLPSLRAVGSGRYQVFLNGCAEDEKCVAVYGANGKELGKGTEPFEWPDADDQAHLTIKTRHGIIARFTFSKGNLSAPTHEEICYPWSKGR